MGTMATSAVSIIVPTLREAENLPELVERIDAVRKRCGVTVELLLMDDDSRDGTVEWVRDRAPEWTRLHVRTERHGLARAVVDGIRRAVHWVVVVMDADLSHPPERIPALIAALDDGAELAIGSRYVVGASTDRAWHWLRALNSRLATALARPLTPAADPMSGFLAFDRRILEKGGALRPLGYKIGLELIVKCDLRRVHEVPIDFVDRRAGSSKLDLREQWRYLRHLARLYRYRLAARGRSPVGR